MSETLTAQQRAQLFAVSTRQNMQMLAKETVTSFPNSAQFTLPKARLLSGCFIKAKIYFDEAFESFTPYSGIMMAFGNFFRRISLDLNNGFQPYVISGRGCSVYNAIDINANNIGNWGLKYDEEKKCLTTNFYLSCTTNPRDPVGLILLQNDQTNVTLSIDLGMMSEVAENMPEPKKVDISVMTETFSIPANVNAYPDLSVLKMVHSRKDSLPTEGQQVIKLSTGTMYRKIIFVLTDENGEPMLPEDITSNIELVFNQADVNYSISAEMLRTLNEKILGTELPEGVYVFDFSNGGGFVNLGGTRDLIDSANLTEFWLRFTTAKKGKCEIVTETLARLS